MSLKCSVVLAAVLNFLTVDCYTFETNASAYQRLELHAKHSSFGTAVAVHNEIALVTAPYYSFNEFHDPDGILHVYRRDYGYWTLIRGITDLDYGDEYGMSVAMHTDYFAVVGAPNAKKYGDRSGAAYFMYIESNPYKTQAETQQIIQSERHSNALFGSSVAIGEVNNQVTVAIGAPGHRDRGAVFTYTRQSDGTLSNEEILYTTSDTNTEFTPSRFGGGVQVGYDMVLGGAPNGKHGFVYVFQRGSGQSSFSQGAVLAGVSGYTDDNDDVYNNDDGNQKSENLKQVEEFGETIVIGDGYIFVGAPYAYSQSDTDNNYGSVAIYSYTTGTDNTRSDFTSFQIITPDHLPSYGLNSFFGKSLSYSETDKRLVIGSPYGTYPSTLLGFASLFVFDSYGNTFELETTLGVDSYLPEANSGDLQNIGETERAGFGASVSISGGYVLVGAPQGASHYGDAYFFAADGMRDDSSTSFYDLLTGNIFTTLGLFLFPVAIIGLVMLIILWRKFRDSNYEDSFSSFIIEEVGEFFGRVQTESVGAIDSCTSLQFMGEDDSAHSTHPMIVGSSVPTKKKPKKSKSAKFKSKTGIGNYESANFEDNL